MTNYKINFRLDKPKIESETYIILSVSGNGRIRSSTKEKIYPYLWDSDTQRPTTERKIIRSLSPHVLKNLRNINTRLDDIEYMIKDFILDMPKDGTLKDVEYEVDRILGNIVVVEEKHITVVEYYRTIIAKMKSGELLTKRGKKYSTGTIKTHNTNVNYLLYYEQMYETLYFDDINSEFKVRYVNELNRRKFKINTISRGIGFIKFICQKALDECIHSNTYYQSDDFFVEDEEVYSIYLTEDDLNAIRSVDLSTRKNDAYSVCRDIFLVGCYTALRFSDYSRIRPEYIRTTDKGVKVIDMMTKKTEARVVIPFLFPDLDDILSRYNYYIPKTSDIKVNKHMKNVAKLAGLDQDVVISETVGGERVERVEKKYNLVTTHTARRTGATNLYKMGYSAQSIMKITGHKTEKMFLKYIKIGNEENAELMAEKNGNILTANFTAKNGLTDI